MPGLTEQELIDLIRAVFPRKEKDRVLAVWIDFPQNEAQDNPDWLKRRQMTQHWVTFLRNHIHELNLDRILWVAYPNVGTHNAELPDHVYLLDETLPRFSEDLPRSGQSVALSQVMEEMQLALAPTEYSTTAPLKNAAKRYHFRAATMPGFCENMLPALRLDYTEIGRRVDLMTGKLNIAQSADVVFLVDNTQKFTMFFDLRFRPGHASSGRFPEEGTAGNLPSGEAYIVPYEGERGEASLTHGVLPVQFGQEVVFYRVEQNRARAVEGEGEAAKREKEKIMNEPAYANIAELGFGVLGEFGIKPIGEVLLDEKLGFHIAFGRSDHFGGSVGPAQFSSPKAVVHTDRIYIPETQPRVHLCSVLLHYEHGGQETIIENGRYLIFSNPS